MARKSSQKSVLVTIYLALDVLLAKGRKTLKVFLNPELPLLAGAVKTAHEEHVRDWSGFAEAKVDELIEAILEQAKSEKDFYRRRGMYTVVGQIQGLKSYKAKAGNKAQYRLTAVLKGHSRRNAKVVSETPEVEATCAFCGKVHNPGDIERDTVIGRLMRAKGFCFECAFWHEKLNLNPERVARIGGTHFYVEAEDAKGPRGFGGDRYTIRFNDGRVVETTNLWHQGPIPERFRKMLPDNAVFVR